MNESENTQFFSKLWKCPFRRFARYARKFVLIIALGIFIWMSLDLLAIVLMKPRNYPPFISLIIHAILTITLSLLLTLGTHKLSLRLKSRFRLIRAFLPPKGNSKPETTSVDNLKTKSSSILFRILFYTSIIGFICGLVFGYSHMKGWISDAEKGMILYITTLVIAALVSSSLLIYQMSQNRLKTAAIKIRQKK